MFGSTYEEIMDNRSDMFSFVMRHNMRLINIITDLLLGVSLVENLSLTVTYIYNK